MAKVPAVQCSTCLKIAVPKIRTSPPGIIMRGDLVAPGLKQQCQLRAAEQERLEQVSASKARRFGWWHSKRLQSIQADGHAPVVVWAYVEVLELSDSGSP